MAEKKFNCIFQHEGKVFSLSVFLYEIFCIASVSQLNSFDGEASGKVLEEINCCVRRHYSEFLIIGRIQHVFHCMSVADGVT